MGYNSTTDIKHKTTQTNRNQKISFVHHSHHSHRKRRLTVLQHVGEIGALRRGQFMVDGHQDLGTGRGWTFLVQQEIVRQFHHQIPFRHQLVLQESLASQVGLLRGGERGGGNAAGKKPRQVHHGTGQCNQTLPSHTGERESEREGEC